MAADIKNRNIWILEYPDGRSTISQDPKKTMLRLGYEKPTKIFNMHTWSKNEAMKAYHDLKTTIELCDDGSIIITKPNYQHQ
jgi:hypothetical protein